MNSCLVVGVVGRWLLLVGRYERLLLLLWVVLKKTQNFLPVRALCCQEHVLRTNVTKKTLVTETKLKQKV